jgi:hypothetical protein
MYGGIYKGIVSAASDPQNGGRVQVFMPAVPGTGGSWAVTCLPPDSRGSYRAGQSVWIMFENGDFNRPVVMGLAGG